MKMNQSYETILEFNQIKQKLCSYAATAYAKEKINAMKPILSESRLKGEHRETADARIIIDAAGTPPVPELEETKTLLTAVEISGLLYPAQLEKFLRFIVSCRRLKQYLKKAIDIACGLASYGEVLDTLDVLYEQINLCIRGDTVDSGASKELAGIRREIEALNSQIKTKLETLLKSKGKYCSDSFVSMKNGRYTLPVKREYKHQVPGTVIAVSSTGTTCFIEPDSAVKITERLTALQIEESLEEERILYMLAALIDEEKEAVRRNMETIETLDFAFAKGRLSAEMRACTPAINTSRYIKITQGRHPLLNRDTCVPLDFELGNGIRGIIITGPNTGGKTVALKLVGLFSVMAQCGLQLPCESADICMNSNVLCDIGDGQNISENLSTFSAHITNIVDILNHTGKDTLVLLDELGSGTDPDEGMGIAVAVLEQLRQNECLFVATTHYPEVKEYAEQADGLVNARMTFDKKTLKPRYKLVIGEAGESCAFYIAKQLGFPERLLRYAYQQTYGGYTDAREKNQRDNLNRWHELTPEQNNPLLPKLEKMQQKKELSEHARQFGIGDSVIVYPQKKIGIVYQTADEKGMLGIQIQGRKEKINHKRLSLRLSADVLYPPNYDFDTIFDTVENRKAKHKMKKKYCEDVAAVYENPDGGKDK